MAPPNGTLRIGMAGFESRIDGTVVAPARAAALDGAFRNARTAVGPRIGGKPLSRCASAGVVRGNGGTFVSALGGTRKRGHRHGALGVAGHGSGWPLPHGGSQKIADALAGYLRSLGGEIETSRAVTGASRRADCDVRHHASTDACVGGGRACPRAIAARWKSISLPGPGVFKMDWALDTPVPWRAAECARAGTLHLGGTLDEIAQWERCLLRGRPPVRILVTQPSLFDKTRAPAEEAYAFGLIAMCRTGSRDADLTNAIEAQIERFAPGFRSRILARAAHTPASGSGTARERQPDWRGRNGRRERSAAIDPPANRRAFTARRWAEWCSFVPRRRHRAAASTGMCGYHAARMALQKQMQ